LNILSQKDTITMKSKVKILFFSVFLFAFGCELVDSPAPTIQTLQICGLHGNPYAWTQTENELVQLTVSEADAGNYLLTLEDTGDPDCPAETKVVLTVAGSIVESISVSAFPHEIDFQVSNNFTKIEIDATTLSRNCEDPTGLGGGTLPTELTCTLKKI